MLGMRNVPLYAHLMTRVSIFTSRITTRDYKTRCFYHT